MAFVKDNLAGGARGISDWVIIDDEHDIINAKYFNKPSGTPSQTGIGLHFDTGAGKMSIANTAGATARIYFNEPIDVTTATKLKTRGHGYLSNVCEVYISQNGLTPLRSVSLAGNSFVDREIDLSDITGNIYVGVNGLSLDIIRILIE